MNCNHHFFGNSFNNGQCYSCNPRGPPPCNNLGTEIVGEGDVTAITQPDGTCQFFFLPTVKWWTPQTANTCPMYTNTINMTQNNPYWISNSGVWFVRTITNPVIQPSVINPICPRYEIPRVPYPSDSNLHILNPGYQLKFHSDKWTSTTDIHYFYPSLRRWDNAYTTSPLKGSAAVQVETAPATNTICHYEFVCPKPCLCKLKPEIATIPKSESAMSLDATNTENVIIGDSGFSPSHKTVKSGDSHARKYSLPLKLLPNNGRKPRLKLERQNCSQRAADNEMKDATCECFPPPCSEKMTTTYSDKGTGADANIEREKLFINELSRNNSEIIENKRPSCSKDINNWSCTTSSYSCSCSSYSDIDRKFK